jgi:hypothetical protein
MNERTVKLHFKLIRLVRGAVNAWELWAEDEAVELGLFQLLKEADPRRVHGNNHQSAQLGREHS